MAATIQPTATLEYPEHPRRPEPHEQAEALLRGSAYLALRGVTCVVRDGVAHLHGYLPTYYLKQVAQALVADVEGVRGVVNHVEVLGPPGRVPEGASRLTPRAAGTHSTDDAQA